MTVKQFTSADHDSPYKKGGIIALQEEASDEEN